MDKPKPPDDLWKQIDAEMEKTRPPAGSFTRKDFSERYDLTEREARTRLQALEKKGLVKRVGIFGAHSSGYYILIDKNEA